MEEIYIPIFTYKDTKEKYKRNANFISELRWFENLKNTDLKYDVIEIERIGYKYVTIRHYDMYMLNACPFLTKRKIQIRICFFYNLPYKYQDYGEYVNIDLNKLQLNKPYHITRIEKKMALTPKYQDEVDFFAVINLKPTFIPTMEINNCCACFEDKQLANENGYFKCSHNDCICHKCFDSLTNKICPLCRSS